MSRNKRNIPAIAVALAGMFSVLSFFSGCASAPRVASRDQFAILGAGAQVYLVLPVAENRQLAGMLASSVDSSGSTRKAIDRIRTVYAAVYPDGRMRIVAEGTFFRSASPFIFPSSEGWKKATDAKNVSWYHHGSIDAVLPQNNLAYVAASPADSGTGSGIPEMLANRNTPGIAPVPDGFAEDVRADLTSGNGAISLFVSDASPWISSFLGPDITLPVDHVVVRAMPETGTKLNPLYRVSVLITAKDARTARAMTSLLSLAFPEVKPAVTGTDISVSEFSMSAERLADFAKNLYF